MTRRILVVCAQNVCRSAYLAAILGSGLDRAGAGIDVVSRGVRAEAGLPMCEIAVRALPAEAAARGGAHRSRVLKEGDIERAALVLTATTAERGSVALLSPAARSRTFTVREFLLLAGATDDTLLTQARSRGELLTTLHRRRGMSAVVPATVSRRLLPRRTLASSPLDIGDAHRERAALHRALFPDLQNLAQGVMRVLTPTPS